MTYAFPPDLRELVGEQMASGKYASEDELLRHALRALSEEEEDLAAVVQPSPTGSPAIRACRLTTLSTRFEQGTSLARIHEV